MRATASLALLASGCALLQLSAIKRSHPELEGRLQVRGLNAEVTVHRDAMGVPHVRAADEHDAWFALGVLHAQDRLWQAEVSRRLAWGELSEWLGAGPVELDLFARQLDLRARAEANVERLEPEVRAAVEAYAAGLTAGSGTLKVPPIEYRLVGVEPEPWDAADVLAIGFLQSWNLQDNLGVELAAWAMRDKWDAAMLDRLFALDDTVPPIEDRWETLRTQAVTGALTSPFKAWTGALGGRPDGAEASNNWVVGPSRTASGKPILANDPHLGQSVPSLWYVADVSGGDMHVAGATLPGLFGVPIGHNERVAWGLTNLMADVVDVAVLERVGDDAVRIRGETVPLESAVVRIVVKGGDPVRRTVYRTPIGPVISELEGTHVLVLRWHALELEDDLAGVVHGLAHSKSASSLVEIADSALMVAQGVVIADVDGDWGYQYVGSVPVRSAHSGRVPHDGSASGWDGWFASLPGEHAPERGWVVTANARPTHDRSWNDEKEPIQVDAIGSGWVPPHRAGRLAELLEATEGATPADMSAMQLDLLDPVARDRLPALLEGVTPSEVAKPCTDVLAAWDHTMAADSAGAAVWTRLQTSLTRAALADDLSAEGLAMYLSATGPSRTLLAAGKLEGWMDDRVATVSTALDEACRRVIAVHGVDPAGWRWGDAHPLRLEHRFASGRDMLAEWNMREVPFGGNGATVAAAGHGWLGDERPVGGMASLRLVVPLDDVGAATLVHPGGQAGQPKSPFYASHFDAFVAGETVPLWFDDDDVGRESVWSITLAP